MSEQQFRFQGMQVWQRAAKLSRDLFRVADDLERRRLFRFAEQLRGVTMSITNNIAEGSGSTSKVEFAHFLNMARRSCFEVANIFFLLGDDKVFSRADVPLVIGALEEESKMLLAFMRTLKK